MGTFTSLKKFTRKLLILDWGKRYFTSPAVEPVPMSRLYLRSGASGMRPPCPEETDEEDHTNA